jgi:uncharacterized protein (DUF952 family)
MPINKTLIYKLCAAAEWQEAERAGVYHGSAVDHRDGFIHCSAEGQVADTAAKWFADVADLVLVAIDATALGDGLRWEPSRGGALFPHIYGPLPLAAVRWTKPVCASSIDLRQPGQ